MFLFPFAPFWGLYSALVFTVEDVEKVTESDDPLAMRGGKREVIDARRREIVDHVFCDDLLMPCKDDFRYPDFRVSHLHAHLYHRQPSSFLSYPILETSLL